MLAIAMAACDSPPPPPPPPPPDPVQSDVDAMMRDGWRIEDVRRADDWAVIVAATDERMKAVFRFGDSRGEHERESTARWRLHEPPQDRTGDGAPEFTLRFDLGGNDWGCRGLELFRVDGECLTPDLDYAVVKAMRDIDGQPALIVEDLRFQWIPFLPHVAGLAVERILTFDPHLGAFREDLNVAGPIYERRLREIAPVERDVEYHHAGLEYWMLSEILGRPALGHAYFLKVVPREEEFFDSWERNARFRLDHHCAFCPQDLRPLLEEECRYLPADPDVGRPTWADWRGADGIPEDMPLGLLWLRGSERWVWLNGADGATLLHYRRGDLAEFVRMEDFVWRVTPADVTGDGEPEMIVEHCFFGCSMMRTTRLSIFRGAEEIPWEQGSPPVVEYLGTTTSLTSTITRDGALIVHRSDRSTLRIAYDSANARLRVIPD